MRVDSEARNVAVSYSGCSSGQLESVTLSEVSSAEARTESDATQNIDTNVVPVVCDDVTFLMVKDDFAQKPTELSTAADKTEDTLSVLSSSGKDSGHSSLKTSSLPSDEMLNCTDKNDKAASDTASMKSCQV